MKLFSNFLKSNSPIQNDAIDAVKGNFVLLKEILESNKHILKSISDIQESSFRNFRTDTPRMLAKIKAICEEVDTTIDKMIVIGGEPYSALKGRNKKIFNEIELLLKNIDRLKDEPVIKEIKLLNKACYNQFGGKNANLGEILSLNIPVPEGFAISSGAYKVFIESNNLNDHVYELLTKIKPDMTNLKEVSVMIRKRLINADFPKELAEKITDSYMSISGGSPELKVAVRSSAIGEDSALSFAGQYDTYLNICKDELIENCKKVFASKFSENALYYLLNNNLDDREYPMCIGIMKMIDSRVSGVLYTKDPVTGRNSIIINAAVGYGETIVSGTTKPCVYNIPKHVIGSDDMDCSCRRGDENSEEQLLSEDELRLLIDYALKIEKHFGSAQDIEWTCDKNGKIVILQSRPLKILGGKRYNKLVENLDLKIIGNGDTTVCPGAACGEIYNINSFYDLADLPNDIVLVSRNPYPELITSLKHAKAIITMNGGVASHLATIAREYGIPYLSGVSELSKLGNGIKCTVDATKGVVYDGEHPELVNSLIVEKSALPHYPLLEEFDKIIEKMSPLNIINPSDPDFIIENCETFHDITRYIHQKALEEMFAAFSRLNENDRIGIPLKSQIPLNVNIVFIDREISAFKNKKFIEDKDIRSKPMTAFWDGIKEEGWPDPLPNNLVHFTNRISMRNKQKQKPSETQSFAVLSEDFMLLSLKMGYHFTTFEAMCTPDIGSNYIKMRFKEGGASIERRIRRIKLLSTVLSRLGFFTSNKADFLDTMISYETEEDIIYKLGILGRLAVLTKQLDMALSNDSIAKWYTKDIMRKLGLRK